MRVVLTVELAADHGYHYTLTSSNVTRVQLHILHGSITICSAMGQCCMNEWARKWRYSSCRELGSAILLQIKSSCLTYLSVTVCWVEWIFTIGFLCSWMTNNTRGWHDGTNHMRYSGRYLPSWISHTCLVTHLVMISRAPQWSRMSYLLWIYPWQAYF